MKEKLKSSVWNFGKAIIAFSLFGLVLSKTSWKDIASLWSVISMPWLILAMVFFYINIWVMGYRYWVLIFRKIPFRENLSLVALLVIITNTISSSIGIVTYLGMLRKKHNIQLSSGLGSVLFSRISDLIVLLAALVSSSVVLRSQIVEIQLLITGLTVSIIAIILGFLFLLIFKERFVRIAEFFMHISHLDGLPIIQNGLERIKKIVRNGGNIPRNLVIQIALSTLLHFSISFLFLFSSFKTFSLSVSFWIVLFMLAINQLVNMIPIHLFGGIGVIEITSFYIFGIFGYPEGEIIPILIGLRAFIILVNTMPFLHILLEAWINQNQSFRKYLNPL